MERGAVERLRLKKQIQDHLVHLIDEESVTREQLADVLHVTKQAISSYITGRTMPKPHIVKRLLGKWGLKVKYRGVEFGPEAFGVDPHKVARLVLKQDYLFEAISALRRGTMRVEVDKVDGSDTELRVIIKIRA